MKGRYYAYPGEPRYSAGRWQLPSRKHNTHQIEPSRNVSLHLEDAVTQLQCLTQIVGALLTTDPALSFGG